jgi:hypothetical protein
MQIGDFEASIGYEDGTLIVRVSFKAILVVFVVLKDTIKFDKEVVVFTLG